MKQRSLEEIQRDIHMLKRNQQEVMLRLTNLENELAIRTAAHHQAAEQPPAVIAPLQTETPAAAEQPSASPPPPPAPDQRRDKELEMKIGGTWLNRIGVVAVILGLAYFLKYSIDNAWIGPIGRVSLGILLGLAMFGFGEKLREKYSGYAQGLLGGGSLALFFSIYAAYNFYELIPSLLAFAMMALITVLTVFMAIRHKSLTIAILGIIGGYTTPFLVGEESGSLVGYYAYYALLTGGVLAVSIYQKWNSLRYLSFAFSHLALVIGAIGFFTFSPHDEVSSLVYSVILFLYFLGIASIYNIRQKRTSTGGDVSLILMNAMFFLGESSLLITDLFDSDYIGFYVLLLAILYMYLSRLSHRLNRSDRMQTYSLFIVAFIFVTLAIPLQLEGFSIGMAWLAEAIGLAYMAKRLQVPRLFYGSMIVLALGTCATQIELFNLEYEDLFLLNIPTLMALFMLAAYYGIARLQEEKPTVARVLKGLLLFFLFEFLTLQNEHYFSLIETDFFSSPRQISLSIIWMLYAISLFVIGLKRHSRTLRFTALGLIGLVILKAFFIDLAELATIFKILLFIVLGLLSLGISFIYQKKKHLL
ncbi:DUF2339 domain-containing protein [Brevibacillus migulae]|uniref:DUF2339 domain-containing protein n=1 Tax=Brevibacillus migulae TaxID=1644114 RepID=UPI00106E7E6E|nr:DUF2339 domain-containing protein [Brevibacillus migulae]